MLAALRPDHRSNTLDELFIRVRRMERDHLLPLVTLAAKFWNVLLQNLTGLAGAGGPYKIILRGGPSRSALTATADCSPSATRPTDLNSGAFP